MRTKSIVAFCGFKGHGKDTAAEVLINEHEFVRISFADGLRKTVCTALREDESFFTDPATKENIDPRINRPRRAWLQHIGTEGFRSLWEDVWVEWWRGEVLSSDHDRVVVADMRFPNEFTMLKEMGAKTIRIVNPNIPPSGDLHESEIHQEKFPVDNVILNNGTIPDLHQKVKECVFSDLGSVSPSWRV